MFPHPNHCPANLRESMSRLYSDKEIGDGFGFIVTRFGETDEHKAILALLKEIAEETLLPLKTAEYAQFHDGLWANVQCYMHACRFAIAVFEDAEGKGYNPNVALETGYLLAIEKPTLVLKSNSLDVINSDLLWKLYVPYDTATDLSVPKSYIVDWISRRTASIGGLLSAPVTEETLTKFLNELYPSIKGAQPGDFDHFTRHLGGLTRFGYSTIEEVQRLLEATERARSFVSRGELPEFAICSISHSLALLHPEYRKEGFWKATTIDRITEAAESYKIDWGHLI